MEETCILYLYHRLDPLTIQHYDLLCRMNPEAVVVPLTNDISEYLPNSVDVKDFDSPWDTTNKWRSLDTTFYLWFLNRQLSAKRYILFEYDCRCLMPVAEAYAEVWDAEVSCRRLFVPEVNTTWFWFSETELAKLPPSDRPYAAGVVPFVGTMLSHEGASRVLDAVTTEDVFCELRLGTAIRKAGLKHAPFPSIIDSTICSDLKPYDLSKPGIYHPVKPRDFYETKMAALRAKAAREQSMPHRFRQYLRGLWDRP